MTKEQHRMLAYLKERQGSWVNARELTPIACAYCRVIRELRAMGYSIENRVQRDGRKTVAGFYMLLTDLQVRALAAANGPSAPKAALDGQRTLFDLGTRHRDE